MSLQKLCLNTIINHFKYYNTLFRSAEDVSTKRHFEFLQRKYSFEIASGLHAKNDLREEYIDLTVNKYLKVLTTEWFGDCSWDTIYSKFEEIGPNLLKVHFCTLGILVLKERMNAIPWQDVICYLTNLEVLSFRGECQAELFQSIAKYCENIVEIQMRGQIKKDSIKALCFKKDEKVPCSKLKRLFVSRNFSLNGSFVCEDDMKDLLKNLPSLERTNCYDLPKLLYKLHKDDLSALDKVEPYKLVSLDILKRRTKNFIKKYPNMYYNLLKICLSVCPHLKALKCYFHNEETLEFISRLYQLEKLHLVNLSNSVIDINNLLKSKGGQLTSLTVQNYIVSVSALAKNCTRLKQLNLNKVDFVVDDDDSKLSFPSLHSCTFEYATNDSTTERAIKLLLSSAPKLESIAFSVRSLLSPEIKTQVLKCCENCSIKYISFSFNKVEMSFLRDIIMKCHSLKHLDLQGYNFNSQNKKELNWLAGAMPSKTRINWKIKLDKDFELSEEESHIYSEEESDSHSEDESDDDDFMTGTVHGIESGDNLTESEDNDFVQESGDSDFFSNNNFMPESDYDDDFMPVSDYDDDFMSESDYDDDFMPESDYDDDFMS